jgi:hypothetical protein
MAGVTAEDGRAGSTPLTKQDFETLARFRFGIRRYLRFSEETVRRSAGRTGPRFQVGPGQVQGWVAPFPAVGAADLRQHGCEVRGRGTVLASLRSAGMNRCSARL